MPEARKPNAKQLEAIETTEGPVLITAGPGTGKTFTLVQRAMHLIKTKKVESPKEILITTFTNKAAGELITRLTDETEKLGIPFNVRDMYIGTFHSICGRILRDNIEHTRLRPNFKILDGFGQQQLVLRNMARLKLLPGTEKVIKRQGTAVLLEQQWTDADDICKFVNALEEEMVDVEELKKDDNPDIVECAEVLEEYRQILRENNMLDFAESQTECYRLLKENKNIRKDLRIKYLMIDEYQDTNYVQERLVMLLGGKDKNICVVGDDDQSLYRFRGATVSNILGFSDTVTKEEDEEDDGEEEKDKKECVTINLEMNYRSNDKIVEFYNKWMEDTEERKKLGFYWKPEKGRPYRHLKSIVPQKEKDKDKKAESVIRISGETEEEWHKNVLDFLQGLLKSGAVKDANQVAFLFESLKDGKVTGLADYLEENGIRVYAPRSNMFFERDEIKLVIGCFMLMSPTYKAYQSADEKSRSRKKGLHEYYRECLEKVKDTEIGKFAAGQDTEGLSYPDRLYRLFGQEPFRSMMDTDISASAAEIRPERNMAIFSDVVAVFESLYGDEKDAAKKASKFFEEYLRLRYKEGVGEYEYDEEYAPKGCVSFLTFHQAKGMEYPIVFVGTLDVNRKTEEEKAAEKKSKKKPNMVWVIEKDYFHGEKLEPYKMIRLISHLVRLISGSSAKAETGRH